MFSLSSSGVNGTTKTFTIYVNFCEIFGRDSIDLVTMNSLKPACMGITVN